MNKWIEVVTPPLIKNMYHSFKQKYYSSKVPNEKEIMNLFTNENPTCQ